MFNILLFTAALVLFFVCALVVLFVLMQRPSANAGMGSALGGATSESVFGGEAAGVLSKATVIFITLFFLLCAGLYFGFIAKSTRGDVAESLKMETSVPAAPEALVTTEAEPAAQPAPEGVPAQQPQQEAQPVENVPAQ